MSEVELLAQLLTFAVWISIAVALQGGILIFLLWMLRRRQVWSLIKFGLRGGSLICKGLPNNQIEILHSSKAISSIPWRVLDKVTGKHRTIFTPIEKVEHTLKNTSNPIHFCPFTFPTNINILTKEKAQLNAEEINALMAKEYTQGYSDATQFRKVGGMPLDTITLIVLFIVGCLVMVMLAFQWQTMSMIAPA